MSMPHFTLQIIFENKKNLIKIGSYADDNTSPETITIGEGLVGRSSPIQRTKML